MGVRLLVCYVQDFIKMGMSLIAKKREKNVVPNTPTAKIMEHNTKLVHAI